MTTQKFYIPFAKVDDEQRMVYGYASTDTLDSQGESISKAAIAGALPDYMRFANIREMHQPSAVGVAKQADVDDKGLYIGVKVVDDSAWAKVKEGVYKGFSVGGKALAKIAGVISKMRLTEISLVDRPANTDCVFDMWKAEGLDDDADDSEVIELRVSKAVAAAVEVTGIDAVAKALSDSLAPNSAISEEATNDAAGAPIAKGLWNVQRLVDALSALRGACESCDFETKQGDHSPELAAEMRAVLAALGSVSQKYLGEELATLSPKTAPTVALADGGGDVAKAGARFSAATKTSLAKVHDMLRQCEKAMVEIGYDAADDDTSKAASGEPVAATLEQTTLSPEALTVAKAAGLELADGATDEDLTKAALVALVGARKRITELEAKPEAPKFAALAAPVAKGEDTNGGLAAGNDTEQMAADPLDVFKAALARPVAYIPTR